jgi:hypothetical protein
MATYSWDEEKRQSNLEKHGVDFLDAARVFESLHIEMQAKMVEGERRWRAIGPLRPPDTRPAGWSGPLVTVVYTMVQGSIRIISARRARDDERQHYHRHIE